MHRNRTIPPRRGPVLSVTIVSLEATTSPVHRTRPRGTDERCSDSCVRTPGDVRARPGGETLSRGRTGLSRRSRGLGTSDYPPAVEHRLRLVARLVSQLVRLLTGVEIHPAATIGRRVTIDHGMGVVIGETAVVGDDVHMYHGVTLGGDTNEPVKRHPTVEDGVKIGANATLLGDITIGENAAVGAGRSSPATSTRDYRRWRTGTADRRVSQTDSTRASPQTFPTASLVDRHHHYCWSSLTALSVPGGDPRRRRHPHSRRRSRIRRPRPQDRRRSRVRTRASPYSRTPPRRVRYPFLLIEIAVTAVVFDDVHQRRRGATRRAVDVVVSSFWCHESGVSSV